MSARAKAPRKTVRKQAIESRLIPATLAKLIPALGSARRKGDDALAWARLESRPPTWTWWVCEYSPRTGRAWGLVRGDVLELGEFDLRELEQIESIGVSVERDPAWIPRRLADIRRNMAKTED